MIRNLLATTAIAAFLTTGAYAQEATTPAPAAPEAPAAESAAPDVIKADGNLATNIIGETVYNGVGDDAENIGNVSDIIIGPEGNIESVVIGVGGFLGIGQKNVALDYSDVDWAERDGDRWIVIPTTKEALQAQPEFDRRAYDPAPTAAAGDPAAPATDTTADAPAATPAPVAPAEDSAATEAPATQGADDTQTAAIDRSTLTEIPSGEVRSDDLVGTTVYGADDANVGKIGDVVLSSDGQVDSIIMDVGGFLGIGAKEVAVGMDNLAFMQDTDGNKYLYTQFTKEQLEAQPAYDEGSYAEQREQQRLLAD